MKNPRGMFVRLRKNEDGATMIEYSILIGIITAVVIGFILGMGDFVSGAWSDLCNAALKADSTIDCTP